MQRESAMSVYMANRFKRLAAINEEKSEQLAGMFNCKYLIDEIGIEKTLQFYIHKIDRTGQRRSERPFVEAYWNGYREFLAQRGVYPPSL